MVKLPGVALTEVAERARLVRLAVVLVPNQRGNPRPVRFAIRVAPRARAEKEFAPRTAKEVFNEPDRRRITLVITATSYPFLNILWTTLIFFAWVIFIWIAITVLIDVFRRRDISGWGKAAWVIFVVVLPWIGVLVYLIANHDGMAERRMKEAQASQAQFDEYVRKTAGGTGGAASRDREG